MARTTGTATLKRDAVDRLVAKLNQIDGIEFVRDAWVNKAPENYGVVELTGEPAQLWADGKLLDSIWRVVITMYTADDDDEWPAKVQAKLEAMEAEDEVELTHTISRNFDYEIGKVSWVWQVNLCGPLVWESGS